MKTVILKSLGILLVFAAFATFTNCSDDDDNDDPIVINDVMVVYNRATGVFSAINKTTGALTSLGSISYEGQPLLGLRDVVYNSANGLVYATSNANSPGDGIIYSINPSTLEATVLNDNANDDWYSLPGIEMHNGKILGTVYWDDYNYEEYSGLIWLNLDGSINDVAYFTYEGDDYNVCCGMGLEYGVDSNQIYISYEREIVVSDLNGNVSEVIELTAVGFPPTRVAAGGGNGLGYVRCLEKDANGILYGLDQNGVFGTINLELGTFNYISSLNFQSSDRSALADGSDWLALSKIPENVFQ
ncbi:hypothetical protein [Psychroserpens sp.]|uniref:hypothetical protein n=1 Tax=Psychroserpens sp. TaxID=2020870 RepID=UPI00385912D8